MWSALTERNHVVKVEVSHLLPIPLLFNGIRHAVVGAEVPPEAGVSLDEQAGQQGVELAPSQVACAQTDPVLALEVTLNERPLFEQTQD